MIVIPAIDLYQGKVVRLLKGDPAHSTVYGDDPLKVVHQWQDQGAKFLHVVDLSSALGEGTNIESIKKILHEVRIPVQVGGGIRTLEYAQKLLALGVHRVVVGTKALDEDFLNTLLKQIDVDKIAVGVDVNNSYMAVKGWRQQTDFPGIDFIAYLHLKGIHWVIYTDISRDGTLQGANLEEVKKLSEFTEMNVIFSGGVSSEEDIHQMKRSAPFLWGVIVGKALYEGKIDLKKLKEF
jgi:phosphoribosylformimino-5-aminoimidazole carboxamide ribotide isomerase